EGEVGMPGSIFVLDVAVITAALVAIAEDDAERGAVGLALEDTGPDFWEVFFLALRNNARLAGPAAAQVRQQVVNAQGQARRATVDDAKIARPVADAGRGDAKQLP